MGFIILNGKHHIVFHLGMTGKFRFSTNLMIKKNMIIFQLKFNNGINLKYNDVRKFGFFLKLAILLIFINLKI